MNAFALIFLLALHPVSQPNASCGGTTADCHVISSPAQTLQIPPYGKKPVIRN